MNQDNYSVADQPDFATYMLTGLNKAVLFTSAVSLVLGGFLVTMFAR